jgi:hypothetical protein
MLDPVKHFAPGCRNQPSPNPRRIDQVVATLEAHDKGIDAESAGNVAADNELLSEVDPILLQRPVR